MIVHKHANVTIEYDQAKQRLKQTWSGFIPSKDFRDAIDATVVFAAKNPVRTIISDTLNQGVVKPEDTEYAGSVMPKLVAKGLKGMAFVIPENIFTQLSLKKFANNEQTKGVQYFKSESDAVVWLNSL
ncbi:MAG: hypothetical protein JXB34_08670 [Bacteroidales bacterium]|nr:hypothetical protein [Bacteroidales bacterium]